MTTKTKKQNDTETAGAAPATQAARAKRPPTHYVSFRKNDRTGKDGKVYRENFVSLGGAWQNDEGTISFPMLGGWVSIRPRETAATQEASQDAAQAS